MAITKTDGRQFSIYIVSKAGSLIYQHDYNYPTVEVEKTFSFPLDIKLELINKNVTVVFGQRDDIKVGHIISSINGLPVVGKEIEDGRDVFDVLGHEENFPISITFSRARLITNEKIVLASTFHSLFAFATQLSPEPKSSGIRVLEADTFKLHCFQTSTGVKFFVITDPRTTGVDTLLHKIYEVYADYALKNPFYSLEMPIRCELFDTNLQHLLEQVEKSGVSSI